MTLDSMFSHLPSGGLSVCCCFFAFVVPRKELLVGLVTLPARSFEGKDRLNMVTTRQRYQILSEYAFVETNVKTGRQRTQSWLVCFRKGA